MKYKRSEFVVNLAKFSSRMALEYAFAIYRARDNSYVAANKAADMAILGNTSNLQSVLKTLQAGEELPPSTFSAVYPSITQEDRDAVDELDTVFKSVMFKSLAGQLTDFEEKLYIAFCSEEITAPQIGFIAYVPEYVNRVKKEQELKRKIKEKYQSGGIFEGKTVEGVVEVLEVRDIHKNGNTFRVVMVGMDGFVFKFYNNSRSIKLNSEGRTYYIKGRVTGNSEDRCNHVRFTRLNYVRAKPCQNQ